MESLLDQYIKSKKLHKSFFKEFNSEQRIKFASDIVTIKTQCDTLESRIIRDIINNKLDYYNTFNQLSRESCHQFLKENDEVNKYISSKTISQSLGYDNESRVKVTKGFRDLCIRVWDDCIITEGERKELDDYCKENKIDVITKNLIEESVIKEINKEGFKINEIIEYYFSIEKKEGPQIQQLLLREYKQAVSLERVENYIVELTKSLNSKLELNESNDLLYTLNFNGVDVYIVAVNGNLSTSKDFDIAYVANNSQNFKVLITKDTFINESRDGLINIIADAICYKVTSSGDINQFLEMKTLVKQSVSRSLPN
jgi:hypothetical protein